MVFGSYQFLAFEFVRPSGKRIYQAQLSLC